MSQLQDKPFYGREWAFEKLRACLAKRPTSSTCGTLIMADSGCGKTRLCSELSKSTQDGLQVTLSSRLVASHFCSVENMDSLSPQRFLHSVVSQLSACQLIGSFKEALPDNLSRLTADSLGNVDEFVTRYLIGPLQKAEPLQSDILYIVVDGLDESESDRRPFREGEIAGIAQLLARYHHTLPPWLALICTCNSKAKRVAKLFTGFRKLSLDDISKSYVVRDIQQYILYRLDREEALRRHLNKDTAEILDKLHVKSNGCILYIELILDLVAQGTVSLRQVRDIPGTLFGLYTWQCQFLFPSQQTFDQLARPVFNTLLAAHRPLNPEEIYSCVKTRDTSLERQTFMAGLKGFSQLLKTSQDNTVTFLHGSFGQWLQDIKFCSKAYLCDIRAGHEMLALSYTLRAPSLSSSEICTFANHLQRSNDLPNGLDLHQQALWMIMSGAELGSTDERAEDYADLTSSMVSCAAADTTNQEDQTTPEDVNLKDDSGTLPLCRYAAKGDIDSLNALIKRGADVNACDGSGQTALILASRAGHLQVVKSLLAAGCDVHHLDVDGCTALRAAAWGGHHTVVESLLEAGAEVDCPDRDLRTALCAAAWEGHESVVRVLLDHDADTNRADSDGRSPLLAAAYLGHASIASLVLSRGADINLQDNAKRTALSVACLGSSSDAAQARHIEVIKILLQAGADVNHADKEGLCPLHIAAFEGHLAVCRELLTAGAQMDSVDLTQRTPLLCCVSMNHRPVCDFLIERGADIYHLDLDGRTVLGLACLSGHIELVERFLQMGMDEMHRDNFGVDCLHLAAMEGHDKVVKMLVDWGAEVNSQDNQGRTAVFLASQQGRLTPLDVLLAANADADLCAHNGKSPLRVAAVGGHIDCLQELIAYGASVVRKDIEGRPIIYNLALDNRAEAIPILVQCGAEVDAVDSEGRTALHVASWQGHLELAETLLDLGASVDAHDNEKRTPLQSAAWQGHDLIADLLCKRGADFYHTCSQGATPLCIATQEGYRDVVTVLCNHGADPNHADQYGRTALKVAMKASNVEMLRLLENILRQKKPTHTDKTVAQVIPAHTNNYENVPDSKINLDSYRGRNKDFSPTVKVNLEQNTQPQTQGRSYQGRSYQGHNDYDELEDSDEHTHPYAVINPIPVIPSNNDESRSSSDDCDTAPSTLSSRNGSSSSKSSGPQQSEDRPGSFSQQLVQLQHGSIAHMDNIDQILSGKVNYMANPKVNRALARVTQSQSSAESQSRISTADNQSALSRQSSNRSIPVLAGKTTRSRATSKQPAANAKFAGLQNTAREPAFKVQYAAVEQQPPCHPSSYAVRHTELTSVNHSVTAFSKTAKVINNSSMSPSTHDQVEAPPVLPPRRLSARPPLSTGPNSKPTLVGVVRPNTQQPDLYHSLSAHRGQRKETSL